MGQTYMILVFKAERWNSVDGNSALQTNGMVRFYQLYLRFLIVFLMKK